MILPIGPQNAFVLSQGIRRQYAVMVAALCAISDAILISPWRIWWWCFTRAVSLTAANGYMGRRRFFNVVWLGSI
ncbi:LysE family transporter [Budvicia aquatica]|uniref:LysE family transporter n=1 Tax=Budvicia aquatica TaxID=82979 RepID=UPI003F65E29A